MNKISFSKVYNAQDILIIMKETYCKAKNKLHLFCSD